MELEYGRDQEVATWVGKRLRVDIFPPYVAIAVVREPGGQLIGGVVFNEYNGSNIEWTAYAPGCLNRKTLRGLLQYVFETAKCNRLTARTRRDNKAVCKLLPRLGFTYEATMKSYFGPRKCDDAIVFRLDHEIASRWM